MAPMIPRTRPIIGVTGPDRGGPAAWLFTRFAVWRAGGKAVRITPGRAPARPGLDGLIIGGGADVDPALYGEALRDLVPDRRNEAPSVGGRLAYAASVVFYPLLFLIRRLFSVKPTAGPDAARDDLEIGLIERALRDGLPVLGLCRGAQLLNVFFGGSLYQDLGGFYTETPNVRSILPEKRVQIAPGSLLERVLRTRRTRVNALHRQAIKDVGDGLRIVARETGTGVVQAVEHERLPFLLGVQWHPEYLPQKRRHQRLFDALVEAARAARGQEAARARSLHAAMQPALS